MPDQFGWDNNFGNSRPARRRLTPTKKQNEATVAAFNAAHPIGSTIRVMPGDTRGRVDDVQIAPPGAYVLGAHTPVVQVVGGTRPDGSPASYGCIALTHVVSAQAAGMGDGGRADG